MDLANWNLCLVQGQTMHFIPYCHKPSCDLLHFRYPGELPKDQEMLVQEFILSGLESRLGLRNCLGKDSLGRKWSREYHCRVIAAAKIVCVLEVSLIYYCMPRYILLYATPYTTVCPAIYYCMPSQGNNII